MTGNNNSNANDKSNTSTFPIPSSLQDLEGEPYNLAPYPPSFDDDDEVVRAQSFDNLVGHLERGNRMLVNGGLALFVPASDDLEDFDEFEPWLDHERRQALYTLVRKSSSLASATRHNLVSSLCQAVHMLCSILESAAASNPARNRGGEGTPESPSLSSSSEEAAAHNNSKPSFVLPQTFRDALAFHLYMLYSLMSFRESEEKVRKNLASTPARTKARRDGSGHKSTTARSNAAAVIEAEKKREAEEEAARRELCARAMRCAAQSMAQHQTCLWVRGIPDEPVVTLPCRIAYQMLERATGVLARRAAQADMALEMIAATADSSSESLLSQIVAALMDLLHSFEHVAPLVAELCCLVQEEPVNKLAIELLRDISRMDVNAGVAAEASHGKASGVRNMAPFINELAAKRPRLLFQHMSMILPLLDSDCYSLRSAIVTAIGNLLLRNHNSDDAADDGGTDADVPKGSSSLSKNHAALFDVLTERAHDVSSFTRVAVLKAWSNIVASDSLPIERVLHVTSLAIDRLQDKTVLARKNAMQLLTVILEHNPFMGSLDPAPYRDKVTELTSHLKANVSLFVSTDEIPVPEDATDDVAPEVLAHAMSEAEAAVDLTKEQTEFVANVKALRFAASAVSFIELFEDAASHFRSMLHSANSSDVTETLRFLVRARHFQLPCAEHGIKQALALTWSSELSIRDEVLKAFIEVFVAPNDETLPDSEIAKTLLTLVSQATLSERASIEEIIGRLVKDEKLPKEVFAILWSYIAKFSGKTRAAAMSVISMGSAANPTLVDTSSRLRLLHEACLGDDVEERRDWATVRSACSSLLHVARSQDDPSSARCLVLDQIIERLREVAAGSWCNDGSVADTKAWFCAAEKSIDAIFVIGAEPEKESSQILKVMASNTFGENREHQNGSLRMARLFFVVGHVALRLLVYTESLSGAVRRANSAKTLARQQARKNNKNGGTPSNNGMDSEPEEEEDEVEAQLGLAQEAEAEAERRVLEISESEILGNGLISVLEPLVIRVVSDKGKTFKSELLMESATLSLCKFMCISSTYCDKHLPLLFSVFRAAPLSETTLRINTVIALGDLAFRFPNELEPYTPRLYGCLNDGSATVRRHALMVLTHLILNDMVKVKGHVSEIALCVVDHDPRIRDMGRLLFFELSKRSNNPVYNLLPDIVSRLSDAGLNKDDFRTIMGFLLGFIHKERQNEMLMEKFCLRFPKCTTMAQAADLAYCLSELKPTEKSIKCLHDNLKLYKDMLHEDDVHKSFLALVAKAKKNNSGKPELKVVLEEWESKLEEFSSTAKENSRAQGRAKQAKRGARCKKKSSSLSSVEEEEEED